MSYEVKIPENFCPKPWLENYIDTNGDSRPCCLMEGEALRLYNINDAEKWDFFNDKNYLEARKSFLNGIQHKPCQRCWETEALGVTSLRQLALNKYKKHIPKILKERSIIQKSPIRFDVRLSDKCNLECKMCCPSNSSRITQLIEKMKSKGINNSFSERLYPGESQAQFISKYLNATDSITECLFAGGEPFITPEFLEICDSLISQGRSNSIYLQILTNLTVLNETLLHKLTQFKSVELCCSIDSIEEEFEFQRWPAKWKTCKENLEQLIDFTKKVENIRVSLAPCISHLNLRSLPLYIEYIHSIPNVTLHNSLNLVINPSYLHFGFIPKSFRTKIGHQLKSSLLKVKKNMIPKNYINWDTFADQLISRDFPKMSHDELQQFKDALIAWDMQGKEKWEDLYPWAEEILLN